MHVISHRGLTAGGPPENTLAAFDAALRAGAAGVEVDVRLCADGELVCCHDPDLRRIAGVDVRVADADSGFVVAAGLHGGHHVPRFADVLDVVRGRGTIVVDVKADAAAEGAVAAATIAALRRATLPAEDVVVSSFDETSLLVAAAEAPELQRALLTGLDVPPSLGALRALRHGHQALHPFVRPLLADEEGAALARDLGLVLRVWTVNDVAAAERLDAGALADAVITDVPEALLPVLAPAG